MRIAGGAAPGYSTGDRDGRNGAAGAALPEGFGFEWTGQSREEKLAGNQAMVLRRLPSWRCCCLAALYELVDSAGGHPGGAAGRAGRAAGGHLGAACSNDVYFGLA